MIEIKGKYTNAYLTIDSFEEECINQVNRMINHVAFENKVVLMPDAHAGRGATVGTSTKMGDKIVPNITGVDGGCGVYSVNIGDVLNFPLNELDGIIRSLVPTGMRIHENPFLMICSRAVAKQTLDLEEYKNQMVGIYSSSICKETLDESPNSYKDSKMIEEAIAPTATIIDRLKPVLNIKDKSVEMSWKERKAKEKSRQK